MGEILRVSVERAEANWIRQVRWDTIWNAFRFTLYQALLSTALTFLIGIPAAFLFAKYDFFGKGFFKLISTLPFILPTVVTASAFNALFAPRGWVNVILMALLNVDEPLIQIQNSLTAILLAHVFYNTSIVIRVVGGAWSQLDPKLERAALTLGASPFKAFWRVILPQLIPSILSAMLLVFLFDFTSFGVILMLGGPQFSTLEVEIYIQTMQFLNIPLAGFLSLLQLVFTMLISWLIVRISGELTLPVLTKVDGVGQRRAEKFSEKIFVAGMLLILLLLFALPIFGLVARSLFVMEGTPSAEIGGWDFSLVFYRSLFENRRQSIFYVAPSQALRNSLIFATLSSLLTILLSLMLAYGLRVLGRFRSILELGMLLPLGTSAVTLGLGFFITFGSASLNSFYYFLLIPAVHTLVALPFAMRVIQPAVDAIPSDIRFAAGSLGAGPGKIWRFIELPLIRPAVITALIYAFTISLGEFGATSFLTRPDVPTLPIAIFRFLNFPGGNNYGQAMAMAVIILVVCGIGIAILERFQSNQSKKME